MRVSTDQRKTFLEDFRTFFLRGLVFLLPPVLTVWILVQVWLLFNHYVGEPVNTGIRYVVAWVINDARTTVAPDEAPRYRYIRKVDVWVPAEVAWVVAAKEAVAGLPEDPNQRDQILQEALQRSDFPTSVIGVYERYVYYQYFLPYHLSFAGLIVTLVGVYFAGRLLATFFGTTLWALTERALFGVPLVRSVYPHVKQFVEFLLSERSREYNRVVAIEYPRKGIWSIGLVTGAGIRELEEATGEEYVTVFVPYTPWSVAGYAVELPRDEVIDLNISVDEALRFIVTGGVLKPKFSPLTAAGEHRRRTVEAITSRRRSVRRDTLRVGTRGSKLAQAQTAYVVELLRRVAPEIDFELVVIRTRGDRVQDRELAEIGGTGVFTRELQHALLDNRIDLAVHSFKDLPTTRVDGLTIAAVPPRELPFDVLVTRSGCRLHELPEGAIVGTGSLRRQAQLRRLRPDLQMMPIRGNIDTRLRKLDEGEQGLQAVVLAFAGLRRLGLEERITQILTAREMLPAPAQGALAVECRMEDAEVIEIARLVDDPWSRVAAYAERKVLQHLGGGCHAPMGALAEVTSNGLTLCAAVFSADGQVAVIDRLRGPVRDADRLAQALAEKLIRQGADELLRAAEQRPS